MRMRMLRLALSFVIAMPVVAGDRIDFGIENFGRVQLAAFEKAVNLAPLDAHDGDQVRVWYDSVMNGHVTAFIITRKSAWRCSLRYVNDNGKYITVNRGSCGNAKHHRAEIAAVMARLTDISSLDGQSVECPMFDGWQGMITGMVDGKRFEVSIGNNDQCTDPDSKRIDDFTDLVGNAWRPEKDQD